MNKTYKNEDLRDMFGLSHETIRRHSMDFKDFLSESANPPDGKHRAYTESDLRVFAIIASMKATNHTTEDIKAILTAGISGDIPELLSDDSIVLSPTISKALANQEISNLKSSLADAQKQIQVVQGETEEWKARAIKSEGQIELYREQSQQLQEQIMTLQTKLENAQSNKELIELHKEVARLTVLLDIEKEKGKKE